MIREIIVAGIKFNNYSVREMLAQIEKNLHDNVFTSVQEVYMKTLLMAKEDAVLKEAVESIDLTVIAETGILDAANQLTLFRKREIEGNDFFLQFMKRVERNGMTLFLLGESEKEIERVCEYLSDEFPRIKMVGAKQLEDTMGAQERVINEINMLSPNVVLSVLPSPKQELFIAEHRKMLSANLWYGIGEGKVSGRSNRFNKFVMRMLRKRELLKCANDREEEVE